MPNPEHTIPSHFLTDAHGEVHEFRLTASALRRIVRRMADAQRQMEPIQTEAVQNLILKLTHLFSTNTSEMTPQAYAHLDQIADWISQVNAATLTAQRLESVFLTAWECRVNKDPAVEEDVFFDLFSAAAMKDLVDKLTAEHGKQEGSDPTNPPKTAGIN